jgi:putative PIN family toxin of toxin-antitoxin system
LLRIVLDVNVLVAAALSSGGVPARLVEGCADGEFELVLSPKLLEELDRALRYPKIAKLLDEELAVEYVRLVRGLGELVDDPTAELAIRSRDADDDYLIALAASERAQLVSGDAHLLELGEQAPVFTPAEFLAALEAARD